MDKIHARNQCGTRVSVGFHPSQLVAFCGFCPSRFQSAAPRFAKINMGDPFSITRELWRSLKWTLCFLLPCGCVTNVWRPRASVQMSFVIRTDCVVRATQVYLGVRANYPLALSELPEAAVSSEKGGSPGPNRQNQGRSPSFQALRKCFLILYGATNPARGKFGTLSGQVP